MHAGTRQAVSWRLAAAAGEAMAPFRLRTRDAALDGTAATFAGVFNMWAGNVFGNSPASTVCLHEMSWFPQIQAPPNPPPLCRSHP